MEHQNWLHQLDMLPGSESVYARRYKNTTNDASSIEWHLYDVYKIAPEYPLAIAKLGRVFDETTSSADKGKFRSPLDSMEVEARFYNKSSRDDLQGLKLKCGLVVSNFL